MIISIFGDNFEITDEIKKVVDDKFVKKLEKHLHNLDEDEKKGQMKIQEQTRWGFHVNFHMWLPGKKQIYAEEKDDKLQTAIVRLRDEVERQIADYMGRVKLKTSSVSNSN